MDKSEAQKILREQLVRFDRSHSELVRFVRSGHIEAYEVRGVSGATYQVEIQFFWDDQPERAIRVVGSIDDGGIRAFSPLTDDLLVAHTETTGVSK
jgi:hypothetical protein